MQRQPVSSIVASCSLFHPSFRHVTFDHEQVNSRHCPPWTILVRPEGLKEARNRANPSAQELCELREKRVMKQEETRNGREPDRNLSV
eukprot:s2706_g8.t1